MKPDCIIASVLLFGSLQCCFCRVSAEEVPCLIFTGNSETECCIDLEKLNRITFGDTGMTVSSSTGNCTEEMQLLYSLFNHIEIGDAVPTGSVGLEAIEADNASRIVFVGDTKSIVIESDSESLFSMGIFSLKGTLIATSHLYANQSLSVDALPSGIYIALATNDESKLSLKFIIN